MTRDELRRKLAAHAHDAWTRWMRHLVKQGTAVEVSKDFVVARFSREDHDRWKRQMETSYGELPAREQLSDLREADLILGVLADVVLEPVAEALSLLRPDPLTLPGEGDRIGIGDGYYAKVQFNRPHGRLFFAALDGSGDKVYLSIRMPKLRELARGLRRLAIVLESYAPPGS